ncbi:tRNA (adenosine(37)-N6)-threonylcarbamoyltransferase complex ATPase subunit type 1 TsaE [Fusobacterium sp. PH5-44]|uniref:tRNA (adenosine(37)-N6)-threonylcarbamoyltransferase complex ATPase subunit type 1 TsaE n=1 Tax=unclassified Fusobacterium TaxID=2648384 RepID=UPI003D1A47F0
MKKHLKFDEINQISQKLANFVKEGEVVVLIGDLGTGKTTFVQKFAKELGVIENLKSPTFNYVLEYYSGRLPLFHFDVYRISNPEEVYEIGYEDYINGNGVSIIEWGDIISSELPKEYINISLEHCDEDTRWVSISYVGNREREKELLSYVNINN